MPSIYIPDETYERLARRAAAVGTTAEALALPAIEQAAASGTVAPPETIPLAGDAWSRAFEEFNRAVLSRADRYPPGFQADASREAIYEGCGE